MPLFSYKAKGPAGNMVSGTMEADNDRVLASKLKAQKMTLLSSSIENKKGFKLPFGQKVSTKDLSVFARQFATMINAGVPVLQSLNIIHDQVENKSLKIAVSKIREDIGSGGTLSDALAKFPKIFSGLFINMVRAGEAGGLLDSILQRLSSYLEKADQLQRKVKSAMMYPMVVSSIAITVTVFLMVYVIPTFETVFASFGAKLPAPTRILLDISKWMRSFFEWPKVAFELLIGGGIGAGAIYFLKTEKGKMFKDNMMLKLPIFGILIKKVSVAKFARTLGTLIKSGVPILEAMDITAKTAGNRIVESAIIKIRNSIKEGETITEPLKAAGIFPPMIVQMVSVGEETGTLDDMLVKAAEFYDDEVDTAVSGLTSMIEPLLISFMGIVIGGIVIAMFMPMFELGDIVG
jgi:type IV pilus assembly protein PilC